MPLDTLTDQQRAFVSQHLSKGLFSGKQNKATVAAYEAYVAEEAKFRELAAALPREDQETVALIQRLRPIMDQKNAGDFAKATAGMTQLVKDGEARRTQIQQAKQGLVDELDKLSVAEWAAPDKVRAMQGEWQKASEALTPPLPSGKQLSDARKAIAMLDWMVDDVQQEARGKKQEVQNQILNLIDPPYAGPEALKTLAGLRQQANEAMAPPYPTGARFEAASKAIEAFNTATQQEANRIAGRRQALQEALAKLAVPAWADQKAAETMNASRQAATNALAPAYPSPAQVTTAEQAINALTQAIQQETARVAKRRTDLQQRLAGLSDPAGADPDDLKAMKAERDKATDALKDEFPTPANFQAAEAAIGALEGLVRQAKQIGGVSDKYGAGSDTAKQTKGAFKSFRAVLGNVEVNDKLIADAQKALEDRVRELAEKQNALNAAKAMPEGTPEQKRRKKQATEKAEKECDDAGAAKTKAEAYLKAAQGQKNLTDALAGGPLSGSSDQKFKDATAATFIKGFTENPTLAKSAVTAATTAKFPDTIAQGWPTVRDAVGNGLKAKDGTVCTVPGACESYGENLLKMGGNVGGDYFARLPDYLDSGEQFKPDPFGPTPSTWGELARQRTTGVAGALLKDDGSIDMTSDGAKKTVGAMLYNPSVVNIPTPALTGQLLKSLKELEDPQASTILKGVTAPTDPGAQGLVRRSVGKGGTDAVDAKDTRTSVLAAMLKPLDQGPVGSCFATAPARRMRETQPMDAMRSYAEIATKGTYKAPGASTAVPAVTNIPPNEDPIMRSWEYSLATATARQGNTIEKSQFTGAMAPGLDQMRPIVGGPDNAWNGKKAALANAISNAFTFTYDPTLTVTDSNDGSSSQGRYVLKLKAGDKAITTQDQFSDAIAEVSIAALGFGGGSDQANRIKALTKQPAFLNAVCPGKYKPWELASGGFTDQATKTLFGNGLQVKPILAKASGSPAPTEGQRTTQVLTGMLNQFSGKGDHMITMNTQGIHGFNALPNDPSLAELKGATPQETAQKVQEKLVAKGQALKDTDLTADRAAYLFDQELTKAIAGEKNKGGKSDPALVTMLETAQREKRPTRAMKPAQLDAAVKEALTPYNDAIAGKDSDAWKKKEEDAGRPVTPQKLQEKLDALKKAYAEQTENGVKSNLMRDMAAPEFVIADTNWGSGLNHTFFVIAPDPTTGEPKLWEKTDPPGSMAPAGKKWVDTQWESVE
ncbi:MAG TPA: hypothetical protein VHB27_14485 [Rhodopila sp.]|uniref:hypothetical protein n=1 Tax=Rhodopila sp. TaxID=2480087 RepID=UPI002CBBE677|nr:hypothetical protein [Rhodopila sp.]HVY16430.1 hypothetical protein [Rhodopila sp.]